ncbi:MAG TPA: CAP domain-containing protein [Azospirillaceae bacterium]|nr:CAP domain-containing protein [Azospirillaceae bacterium]
MARFGGIVLLCLTVTWAASSLAASLPELRGLALELVNRERLARGLTPLRPDATLDATAQRHAEDMLRRNYFDHVSPEGHSVLDRYIAAGGNRWRAVAENIARCLGCELPPTPEELAKTQQGWMDSPSHRENILNPAISQFGFGLATGRDGQQYSVQTFAGSGGGAVDSERLSPARQQQVALAVLNVDRQRLGLPPLEASETLQAAARRLGERLIRDTNVPILRSKDLRQAVPDRDRRQWREVTASMVACGGCGVAPTEKDIAHFRDRWIEEAPIGDGRFSHIGVAITADGEGRKIAVAVLGRRS